MVYPIWCVMPNDRLVFVDANETVRAFSADEEDATRKGSVANRTIGFQERGDAQMRLVPLEAIGQRFQFYYTPFLIFLHEKLLREVVSDKFSPEGCSASEPPTDEFQALKEKVHNGFIHGGLSIRHVGEMNGSDVGFGLFAEQPLSKGTFLGEYVGLVGSHSSFDPDSMQAYCCQYGTCEGDVHVNALEYGNIIRFINHSDSPNAELSVVQFDGLPHILCVSPLSDPHSCRYHVVSNNLCYFLSLLLLSCSASAEMSTPEAKFLFTTAPRTGRTSPTAAWTLPHRPSSSCPELISILFEPATIPFHWLAQCFFHDSRLSSPLVIDELLVPVVSRFCLFYRQPCFEFKALLALH